MEVVLPIPQLTRTRSAAVLPARSTKLSTIFAEFKLAIDNAGILVSSRDLHFSYVAADGYKFVSPGQQDGTPADLKVEDFYKFIASTSLAPASTSSAVPSGVCSLDNLFIDISLSEFVSAAIVTASIGSENRNEDSKEGTVDDCDSYSEVIGTYAFGSLYDSLAQVFGYELKYESQDQAGQPSEGGAEAPREGRGADGDRDRPFEDQDMLPCEFCNDVFPVTQLGNHQMTCAGNPARRFQLPHDIRREARLAVGFNRLRENLAREQAPCGRRRRGRQRGALAPP